MRKKIIIKLKFTTIGLALAQQVCAERKKKREIVLSVLEVGCQINYKRDLKKERSSPSARRHIVLLFLTQNSHRKFTINIKRR